MSNPAFELHAILSEWRDRNTEDATMEVQRRTNKPDGLEVVRRAFRLVAELEAEVSKLEREGVDPSEYRDTLDFCARATIGMPGSWGSRPVRTQQFPNDKMSLLRSLGHIIGMRTRATTADLSAIPALLDEIEALLEADTSLPFLLVQHMRRLISDIRTSLSRVDDFGTSALADDLLGLAVATKAAEASSSAKEKSGWSHFWGSFCGKLGELTAVGVAGGAAIALPRGM